MYILTIYTLQPYLEIHWQQASEDEIFLKQTAIDYFLGQFFEVDEDASLEENFKQLVSLLESGEADDFQLELRKADG